MMNTSVTKMAAEQPQTCYHEDEFQSHSRKIAELETKAAYKEQMIADLKADMKELNDKMDKLSEDVNKAIKESIKDDSDIDKRVTSLETTVRVLKWIVGLLFGSGILWVIINYVR